MVQFRMCSIDVPQYAVLADKCPENLDNAQVDTQIAFAANTDKHVVACKMKFVFKNGNDTLEMIEVACTFEVAPDSWETFISKEKITIPRSFLAHMAFHTTGTARGVLFIKSEKTPFNRMILPTINVENMIDSDMIIE